MQIKIVGRVGEGKTTIANLISRMLAEYGIKHQLTDSDEPIAGSDLHKRAEAIARRLQGTDDRIEISTEGVCRTPTP